MKSILGHVIMIALFGSVLRFAERIYSNAGAMYAGW